MEAGLRINKYMGGSIPTMHQAAFMLAPHEEVLYGGAAGGGKSQAILMAALQYVDVPGYNALILRRSFAELAKPGALMDRAQQWLVHTDARWDDEKHLWRFPSGATLSFGYIERNADVYQFDGPEYQFIAPDELTAWPEPFPYTYLFSRLRRPIGSDLPLRMRPATNPGGPGHDWVKQRFLTPEGRAAGRLFIPAKLTDNPHLDQVSYRRALSNLDDVTRAQKEDGDWDVAAEGDLFRPDMLRVVPTVPEAGVIQRIRSWDKAGTDASEVKKARYAKFTVGLRMSRVMRGLYGVEYVIESVLRGQWGADVRDRVIREAAGIYRPDEPAGLRIVPVPDPWIGGRLDDTAVLVEQEPGSGGRDQALLTIAQLAGRAVEAILPSGQKEARARPWASQVNAGNCGYVPGPNIDKLLNEMRSAPFGVYMDCIDAGSQAFNRLALNIAAPEPEAEAGVMREVASGYRS